MTDEMMYPQLHCSINTVRLIIGMEEKGVCDSENVN